MHTVKRHLEEIAGSFARSAVNEFRGSSPLYERLSMGISNDAALLAIASCAISKPVPMIFLAAVHYLLLNGAVHPLAAFYPDIHPEPCAVENGTYPLFRDFCIHHRYEIENLITSYHVQTNEVRRCSCLLPAFGIVSRQAKGLPLALVEIGASAGLNLLWDYYGYSYGNGLFYGSGASQVQLTCTVRGDRRPSFPEIFPQIASRIGIDLNPIDIRNESATNWLRSFIWPEHTARFDILNRAIEIALVHPPDLRRGDVLELLPRILETVSPGAFPCLFHTFVSNQMSPELHNRMENIIAGFGFERDISCISIDLTEKYKYSRLELLSYTDGMKTHRHLANCSGHSRWLEWCESV